jgi:hypothetical protein
MNVKLAVVGVFTYRNNIRFTDPAGPVITVTSACNESELYEGVQSTPRIGRELRLHPTTVRKALKRAGVRMRPPVADNKSDRSL